MCWIVLEEAKWKKLENTLNLCLSKRNNSCSKFNYMTSANRQCSSQCWCLSLWINTASLIPGDWAMTSMVVWTWLQESCVIKESCNRYMIRKLFLCTFVACCFLHWRNYSAPELGSICNSRLICLLQMFKISLMPLWNILDAQIWTTSWLWPNTEAGLVIAICGQMSKATSLI